MGKGKSNFKGEVITGTTHGIGWRIECADLSARSGMDIDRSEPLRQPHAESHSKSKMKSATVVGRKRRNTAHARRAVTRWPVPDKTCETLTTICVGLLADGDLSDDKIRSLNVWLDDNWVGTIWPMDVIHAQVRDVLADGVIAEQKRAYLKTILSDLIGSTRQDSGSASGLSTRLPLDKIDSIVIRGAKFCFTGKFRYGTRGACERAITEGQGIVLPRVTMELDYLVIGMMVTPEWAHTSFGRKIEKAIDYRKRGLGIRIMSEQQWVQFL